MHGGSTPRGPNSPHFKHGGRSEYWGRARGPLLAAKERAEAEGSALFDLRPGVALHDERVAELSDRLGELDTPGWRAKLSELWSEFASTGDADARKRLGAHIERGAEWDSAWSDFLSAVDRRAQRSERAIELETKADRALTERGFLQLVGLVLTTIRAELPAIVPGAEPKHAAQLIDRIQAAAVLPMLGVADAPGRVG